MNTQTLNNTGMIALMALNSSLSSVVSFGASIIGGTLKTVSDTAVSAHKLVGIANNGVHLTADRVTTHQQIRDQIKRNDIELEVTEHLVSYGEREESARERAEALADDTVSDLGARKEVFRDLLGLEPSEPA